MQRIRLSEQSRTYYDELNQQLDHSLAPLMGENISWDELLGLLQKECGDNKKARFTLELLRHSLFTDLLAAFNQDQTFLGFEPETEALRENPAENSGKYITFGLMTVGGVLLAICEGYDGVDSLLKLLALPSGIALAICSLFSALSVAVYYGFYSAVIADSLNVKMTKITDLLEAFLQQKQQIELLIKKMKDNVIRATQQEVEEWRILAKVFQGQLEHIKEESDQIKAYISSSYIKPIKKILAAVTGTMYFASGFFVGQSFMLGVFGLSLVAWPALVVCMVLGAAAFFAYWNVERSGVENLVVRWFGWDEEKLDTLIQEIPPQLNDLNTLQLNIDERQRQLDPSANERPMYDNKLSPSKGESFIGTSWHGFYNNKNKRRHSIGGGEASLKPQNFSHEGHGNFTFSS